MGRSSLFARIAGILRSAGLEFDRGTERSQEAPGGFGAPGCSHNGVEG